MHTMGPRLYCAGMPQGQRAIFSTLRGSVVLRAKGSCLQRLFLLGWDWGDVGRAAGHHVAQGGKRLLTGDTQVL